MPIWGRDRVRTRSRGLVSQSHPAEAAQADRYIELLSEKGALLDEPYTRQLDGKLRELRFHMGHNNQRITYYIASGRRIILLTVFRKTRQQERRQVTRAKRAMDACIAAGHTAED